MQADEAEFEGVSNTLDTPSIMTPNIVLPLQTYKPSFLSMDSTPTANNNDANPKSSHLPSVDMKTNGEMPLTSADVKVSRIEDELKQSLSEPRKPTPSPFQKISSTSVFNLDKTASVIVNDDGIAVEVPSTADV